MILTHFSIEGWKLNRNYVYLQRHFKPRGLWLSDESDFGWKEWCESEEFGLERLASATQFSFTDDANILHLKNLDDVMAFAKEWDDGKYPDHPYMSGIDWEGLSFVYDGILITPYLKSWDLRLPTWYLGWDVSSACVWNLNAIEQVEVPLKMIEA